jgi:peptidyl-prolyl cis-trans isomerase B (cyclophilin B)
MEQIGYHPKFTAEQKKIYMKQGGYPSLDYQYTVFGEVTKGMDVVEAISKVKRDRYNRPVKDVKILSVTKIL